MSILIVYLVVIFVVINLLNCTERGFARLLTRIFAVAYKYCWVRNIIQPSNQEMDGENSHDFIFEFSRGFVLFLAGTRRTDTCKYTKVVLYFFISQFSL